MSTFVGVFTPLLSTPLFDRISEFSPSIGIGSVAFVIELERAEKSDGDIGSVGIKERAAHGWIRKCKVRRNAAWQGSKPWRGDQHGFSARWFLQRYVPRERIRLCHTVADRLQRLTIDVILSTRKIEHLDELHAAIGIGEYFADLPEMVGGVCGWVWAGEDQ